MTRKRNQGYKNEDNENYLLVFNGLLLFGDVSHLWEFLVVVTRDT